MIFKKSERLIVLEERIALAERQRILGIEPDEKYFSLPAISNSFISAYWREVNGQPEPNFRHARRIGHAVHTLILEPHKFDRKKYTSKEYIQFRKMAIAVRDQSTVRIGTDGQEFEKEVMFVRRAFNAKGKIDVFDPVNKRLIDLKTTAATSYEEFLTSVTLYQYDRQASFYLDVPEVIEEGIDEMLFVAVTKTRPFKVFELFVTRGSIFYDTGRRKVEHFLDTIERDHKFNYLLHDQIQ